MEDKQAKNPRGTVISFNEEKHEYTVGERVYTSVTTLLAGYFPLFEAERIAYFVAKREGRTKEDVLAEWDEKRNLACEFGNMVHLYAENLVIGGPLPEAESHREGEVKRMETAFGLLDKYVVKLLADYEMIDSELIIFSEEEGISGTIDLIMRNKETGRIAILDWKTSKKVEKKNGYSKPCHPPIEDMLDSNYNKYMLQLNLYKYILESEGYVEGEIDKMILLHIRPKTTKTYVIDYAQDEIKAILEHRRNKATQVDEDCGI